MIVEPAPVGNGEGRRNAGSLAALPACWSLNQPLPSHGRPTALRSAGARRAGAPARDPGHAAAARCRV